MQVFVLTKSIALALLTFAIVASTACSTAKIETQPNGASCDFDGDCTSGACLELAVFGDGGCTTPGKACSKICMADADCASLGAKYKCFAGCGPGKYCGATP
jgi:hypothetical protein